MLTIVWNGRYIDWFDRACVSSLELPKNKKALQENVEVWDIVTTEGDKRAVEQISVRMGIETKFHIADVAGKYGDVLQREIINEMHRCKSEFAMIMAPPDSIFGDGTMQTLCLLGQPRGRCISVPHVRVKPTILDLPWRANSNANLVAAAYMHLHRTWVESDASRKHTNTYAGGCSWSQIGENLYAVTHMLPTTYYAQFNETDFLWWAGQEKINVWDHAWPSKTVAELRHRVVGSSDAAFIAEVTQEFQNIPPCTLKDPEEPDKHWGRAAHHVFNRNAVCIFRGEVPQ